MNPVKVLLNDHSIAKATGLSHNFDRSIGCRSIENTSRETEQFLIININLKGSSNDVRSMWDVCRTGVNRGGNRVSCAIRSKETRVRVIINSLDTAYA